MRGRSLFSLASFADRTYRSARFFFYLLPIVTLLVVHSSFAQRTKTDSLKNLLPQLADSARVDCLNLLSLSHSYLNADTALAYQIKAFNEAKHIRYRLGEAMSLNNQARIAGHQHRNFPLQEKISLQVIRDYQNLYDQRVLAEAYLSLAIAHFCQSKFDRAREACARVIEISKKSSNQQRLGEATVIMGSLSFESGHYEKSFEYFLQGLALFREAKDSYNTAIVLAKIGDLYRLAGDHKTALSFYHQSLQYPKGTSLVWRPLIDLGDAYYALEPADSLNDHTTYLQSIKSLTIRSRNNALSRVREAEKYIANRQHDKAISLLQRELLYAEEKNDTNYSMRLLLDLARTYELKRDTQNALRFTRELLQKASAYQAMQYLRDAYRLMYRLHDQMNQVKSAYYYYKLYTAMKDSVAMDEFSKRLAIHTTMSANEKAQARLELLSKEKQITEQQLQLSEEKLKTESFLKNILIVGVLLLGLLSLAIFRNNKLKQKNEAHQRQLIEQELSLQKLESERTKGELQQQTIELEMKALRAQMNPHFIFNSLNSINRFILQNDRNQASGYLTKFSRLVRLILQNSQLSRITLESELESLQLYLELEAVRFEHHFEFAVKVDPGIDITAVKVPPLIIQPYVENAIWHGLMHKSEKGNLLIDIFEDGDLLTCKILDDGIGRKRASELKSKSASAHKSMGMRISADRIALLHQQTALDSSVEIIDVALADGNPGGTEVRLKLPIQYD